MARTESATDSILVVSAAHGHAPDAQVAPHGVVVEQGDGQVEAARVAQHGGDDLPALAGADDHDALEVVARGPQPLLEASATRSGRRRWR
ncbi:hypothetical protein KSP35_23710 [Aquihabitans sp. G128]|uniref:hypothetical protein n=1 Tax=Aquihabitans sp. G128 TaxID=2849779 RepID=UPI001C2498B1|nr:hypothetical protein [Aquihabitans sp. G128]QXC61274.1 hypothetical protein KSP35_23710 [Aquihabitans sp. G128]